MTCTGRCACSRDAAADAAASAFSPFASAATTTSSSSPLPSAPPTTSVMAAVPVSDEHTTAACDPISDGEELHVHEPAAAEGSGSGHDGEVRCPECDKAFKNKKSMFGHLRSHPNKGYKGATLPATRRAPKHPSGGADQAPPEAAADEAVRSASAMSSIEIFVAFVLLLLKHDDRRAPECARSARGTERKIEPSNDNAVANIDKHDVEDSREAELEGKKRRRKAAKEGSARKDGYECKTCKQVFPTYQALGGHMAGHKKYKQNCAAEQHDDSNGGSEESECLDGVASTVGKGLMGEQHVCKVCMKEWDSGQALGGHMRQHFEKGQASPAPGATHRRRDIDLNVEAQESGKSDESI